MSMVLRAPVAPRNAPSQDAGEAACYSISKAAELLGVSRVTIWRWIGAGYLPVRRLGHRTVRIERGDLERVRARKAIARSRSGVAPEPGAQGGDTSGALLNGQSHADWAEPNESGHVALFYEADEALVDAVSDFIGAAVRADDAAIVIATEAHRAGIEDRLRADGLDVLAARDRGRYVSLNAAETLRTLVVDGAPEPERFAELVGGIVAQAADGGRRVCIFGEMVGLLVEEGNHAAAVRLEELWNELRTTHAFSLLCGYPLDGFSGESLAELLGDVCAEHSHIVPAESYTAIVGPDDRLRAIAKLQQQSLSLQAEIARRQNLEERLREALASEQRAAERTRRLQEITGQLSQSLEAERVLDSIARASAELLQAPVGAVFLFERGESAADFVLAAAHGIDQRRAPDLRLPRHASLAGRAIDEGRTLVVNDVREELGTALPALLTGQTTGSEIAAPITAGPARLGVVKAFSPTLQRFSSDDAVLLTTLAAAAAVALTNARLYREAQDAVRTRDEFLSAAAHDLKTPLTAVKGLAQLLRRQVARTDLPGSERLMQGLERIDASATKMGQQLDELLDLTRLQLGQQLELRRNSTDLVALARRAAADQQQITDQHTILVESAHQALIGAWDGVRLERVLENLLSNAIKYSPEGGRITVAIADEEVGGPWAVLTVRDQGLGIPAADLPRVFERFQRARNVEGRIGGTGVGLASARQIVEQHGGTIAVESAEGMGSTFTVRLPLACTAAEDVETAPERAASPDSDGPSSGCAETRSSARASAEVP
jgi:excisionase family DNA binding protein